MAMRLNTDDLENAGSRPLTAGINGDSAGQRLAHEVTALKRQEVTLLKMVAGMARRRYGFEPHAVRSAATKKIADDLRLAGVPLDEATILKHLRRGSQLVGD